MARVKKFAVNVDELHRGDNVFLGDRKMNVLAVNRKTRRILIAGRKMNCKNCDIRWVPEYRLGTIPRNLSKRKIKNLESVAGDIMDGITCWVPTKEPKPTTSPPGSMSKINVLRSRIERGEQLWHADDVDFGGWLESLGWQEVSSAGIP